MNRAGNFGIEQCAPDEPANIYKDYYENPSLRASLINPTESNPFDR